MKKNYKLGRKKAHRESMLINLGKDLVTHGRIKTTVAKAKALRPEIERMITKARRGRNSDKREIEKFFRSPEYARKMIEDVGPRFENRAGGYTRIIKIGSRQEDSAEMAIIEFVD